jgi:cytoskeletal protein CcmA (bactofilin family)
MPYSSGTFSRVHDFTTDRDAGIKIQASRMDAEMDGIATGLSTAILKDGTQTTTAVVPFAFGISIVDNKAITLGTNSDITIQYDETTNDSLEIAAAVEGAALGIVLKSDQGDDNADQHKLSIADGGTLTLASKISGSFVTYLTHTPNSTVASSTLAVAGNLTVGGNLTLGSGAELSEAELEMLDGITAGTVAASKAVVVDANKDIASFRNITLTGELDAGSLDVSGDADIDGTLEADAITVGGTALNTVIAGVTVTNATNSAHVLVTDNESTNEENLITFVEGATDSTGNVGLEMDGNLSYNPSTGTVTATVFKGNIDAVDGDFDGTLEADAMTLNGSAITTTATLSTGISNGNVLVATSGIADNDFLRVDGTSIEGRSASEVLSDISAAPAAGDSNIVTTGALDSGSITSGFGAINNGSSNITTTGVGTFASLDISGDIDVDGTANLDVVDIDGAVDMASTLTVGGNTTISLGNPTLFLASTGDGGECSIGFKDDDGNIDGKIAYRTDYASNVDNYMSFLVSGTEHIRLSSAGCLMLGFADSGRTEPAFANRAFEAYSNDNNLYMALLHNKTSGSLPHGMFITYDQSPDDQNAQFLQCVDGTTTRFQVFNDGDVRNHDNSYGQTSDERIKSNIKDANSQWDDIKAIQVRNFERKDDIAQHGEGNKIQIGVVAQEIEKVSPKLVRETNPTKDDIKINSEFGTLYEEGDTLPENTAIGDVKEVKSKVKGVSYSVLYMKAIKALQEAMTRIETLEAKVKTLEEA